MASHTHNTGVRLSNPVHISSHLWIKIISIRHPSSDHVFQVHFSIVSELLSALNADGPLLK